MQLSDLQRLWHARQGFSDESTGNPESVVSTTGWVRTLGGADGYISMWSRGVRDRAQTDHAIARGELAPGPAARSCIYLVHRDVEPLARHLALPQWQKVNERNLKKLGHTWALVEALADRVAALIPATGITTQQLRKALGGDVISFGDAGKKMGMSSPLPLAVRHLEGHGRIQRVTKSGRLDTEHYLWKPATRAPAGPPDLAELASMFFSWAGPATVKEFAAWAGIGVRDARSAVSAHGWRTESVDGDTYTGPDDSWEANGDTSPRLLAAMDNLLTWRAGLDRLVAEEHLEIPVPVMRRVKPLGSLKTSWVRSIVHHGRIIGFWDVEPETLNVVAGFLEPVEPTVVSSVDDQAAAIGGFLREQIGHGKFVSIDKDAAMAKRCEWVRSFQ